MFLLYNRELKMIFFNEKDIISLLNGSRLVEEAGYSLTKKIIFKHPLSNEVSLIGVSDKGEKFKITYAEIEGKESTVDSILRDEQEGYSVRKESKSIFVEKKELSEIEALIKEYEKQTDKVSHNFESVVTPEEIKYFLKAEKSITVLSTFNAMQVDYYKISVKYKLDIQEFRSFIMDFQRKIDKFKPNPDYVFNSILEKLTKKAK